MQADHSDCQEYIEQQRPIKFINRFDLIEVTNLMNKCFIAGEFDGDFGYETVANNISTIIDDENHLGIKYEENGEILGATLFFRVPSLISNRAINCIEYAWDVDPDLPSYKRAKIMMKLLNFVVKYYTGEGRSIHISIPTKNTAVQKYLERNGFLKKEILYTKEL